MTTYLDLMNPLKNLSAIPACSNKGRILESKLLKFVLNFVLSCHISSACSMLRSLPLS